MNPHDADNRPQWYVIMTHPRQEDRAERNLVAWNVETFLPKYREHRYRPSGGVQTSVKALFPRYLFARFRLGDIYHKVRFTRGVHSLVMFNDRPTPIDDRIIRLIRDNQKKDGLIRMSDEVMPGDEVVIRGGPFRQMRGVFEREMRDSDRVAILLDAVNFQGTVIVDRGLVHKADTSELYTWGQA